MLTEARTFFQGVLWLAKLASCLVAAKTKPLAVNDRTSLKVEHLTIASFEF